MPALNHMPAIKSNDERSECQAACDVYTRNAARQSVHIMSGRKWSNNRFDDSSTAHLKSQEAAQPTWLVSVQTAHVVKGWLSSAGLSHMKQTSPRVGTGVVAAKRQMDLSRLIGIGARVRSRAPSLCMWTPMSTCKTVASATDCFGSQRCTG